MNTVINFFQTGGAFMYPIAVALFLGLVLSIERWLFLSIAKSTNRRMFNKLIPLIKQKNFSEIGTLSRSSKAPIGKVIASGVARKVKNGKHQDIESAMQEGLMEALPRLEKRTSYLSVLANVATLLGLLGTIMGLIAAFTAVAEADPSEKATLLSQSISVAMNTTAFGLISAIPLVLIHAMIVEKTNEIIDSLEMAATKCLNILTSIEVPDLSNVKKG